MTTHGNQPILWHEEATTYHPDPGVAADYLKRLAAALKDPAFRATPGFPIATDEAILALSDPPTYTACPNPFLPEMLASWQEERSTIRETLGLLTNDAQYHRDPFAADVSEGKNDPIYNAHSYHTKVPHKAIMRYILHYTDPGDVVLDGFCGTGMTGVAAQLCGDKKAVESLGYRVDEQGRIYDPQSQEPQSPFSHLGVRKAVLIDLSPAATFIAYNYNTPVNASIFLEEANHILTEMEAECGWLYETRHTDGKSLGRINYTIWSDVFVCPQCHGEMVFWDVAVDQTHGEIRDEWICPHCTAQLSKNSNKAGRSQSVDRSFEWRFDGIVGQRVQQTRQVPVLINYSVGKKRYEKKPDEYDLTLIRRIGESDIPYWFPTEKMMLKGEQWGDSWRAGYHAGITHVHHFYTRRNLWIMAALVAKAKQRGNRSLLYLLSSINLHVTKMRRYQPAKTGGTPNLPGTLYISALPVELSILDILPRKARDLAKSFSAFNVTPSVSIQTVSANTIEIPNASHDYIFVDPPFGTNLMYSELNFLWEAWLQVLTNNEYEAVINRSQRKTLSEYQAIMESCFREFYRILKPSCWMTVEFHNSQNAVWNAIQDAILHAGFMVADVRTLDKQQGTFKQVTSSAAVKQDLVISAYKPNQTLEKRFWEAGGSVDAAWDFVRQHLEQLPIPQVNNRGVMERLVERQSFLLYDRMVAFHIQRGLVVPISAPDFYQGLRQRYLERDSMIFTPIQAAEYDKRRLQAEGVAQLALFVNDERSAIQWLQYELGIEDGNGPQRYQEIQPKFLRELHQARYEEIPELRTLLDASFLQDEAGRWYVPDPDRQEDLERLRQKTLLREFATYQQGRGRLRAFRSEAIRAGFSHAWKQRDYATIVQVAERLPTQVVEEDSSLLMYVNNALLRHDRTPQQPSLF
ncbi:MAG: DNA methylase [Caldilinea sp. CFX5]|nr:DNA methylase [Caldilinea sp. CFX5]